ncbi:type II toxin-antitoxin system ParD family antitoxin [Leptolyngbya sp. FACHB-671]|uniref:type II toxin-antitoxin system ParD family antitoxin n=1 Tax=Leptolyngbya sp. FACHB-671 TaxID=2692812 RepID=UPI00168A338A|nr:type II toxin-antitoxin system ParD family antitoxin [Leptolyngbya sp. FACHB-671]MBD2065939.1 type II toxin-antitoxin system ParD family antitoxin [Leptolyngbya sp. FACHB-671]
MNVSLTPELEQFVHEKVKSGRYLSASEVVREALRLLEERDRLYQAKLAELQQDLAIGIEQADRGELIDDDDLFAELEDGIRQIEADQRRTA